MHLHMSITIAIQNRVENDVYRNIQLAMRIKMVGIYDSLNWVKGFPMKSTDL